MSPSGALLNFALSPGAAASTAAQAPVSGSVTPPPRAPFAQPPISTLLTSPGGQTHTWIDISAADRLPFCLALCAHALATGDFEWLRAWLFLTNFSPSPTGSTSVQYSYHMDLRFADWEAGDTPPLRYFASITFTGAAYEQVRVYEHLPQVPGLTTQGEVRAWLRTHMRVRSHSLLQQAGPVADALLQTLERTWLLEVPSDLPATVMSTILAPRA